MAIRIAVALFLCVFGLTARAANPSFADFGPNQNTNWVGSAGGMPILDTFRVRTKDWCMVTNLDASGNRVQIRQWLIFQRLYQTNVVTCTVTNTVTSTNGIAFGGTNQWGFGVASGLVTNKVLYADEDGLELGSGRLIALDHNTCNLVTRRGEVYVQCEISKWGTTNFPENGVSLFRGYFAGNQHLSWTMGESSHNEDMLSGQGLIRTITGTDPAAGAELTETVPVNVRWKLKNINWTFVTDATVSTRTCRLIIDDGTSTIFNRFCKVNQTAGQTEAYQALPMGYDITAAEGTSSNQLFIILPGEEIILMQGARMRTITTNLQAGDNYAAPIITVEQWIEE